MTERTMYIPVGIDGEDKSWLLKISSRSVWVWTVTVEESDADCLMLRSVSRTSFGPFLIAFWRGLAKLDEMTGATFKIDDDTRSKVARFAAEGMPIWGATEAADGNA